MKGKLISMWHTALLLGVALALVSFRVPMPVTELKIFPGCHGQPAYYVCPRCGITMEREFMSFCDRCGQRLGWQGCQHVKIVYPRTYSRPIAMAK